jgi:CheY-like chemotaxis protein
MSNFGAIARTLYTKKSREPEKSAPRRRASVMIVDDNIEVLEALREVLQRKYDVVVCSSYAEVDRYQTEDIKVVLLDVKMAPLDGLAVFSLLKQRNQKVRIIFNTAYSGDSEIASKLQELDSDGCLTKGEYSMVELEAAIERAISRSSAPGAPGEMDS